MTSYLVSFGRRSAVAFSILSLAFAGHAESVHVSTFYGGTIVRIHTDGSTTILARNLGFPTGLAADGAGRIYVASSTTNRVRRVHPDGLVTSLGIAPYRAGYTAMAFDAQGRLFLANQDAGGIVALSPSGGSQLRGGGFASAFGMAFDASGILHVAHLGARVGQGMVSQILLDGTKRSVVTGLDSPAGIAFDHQGNIFVAEYLKGIIVRIAVDGSRRVFAAGLEGPQGLAFDGEGGLLVAEFFSGKVTRISMTGERATRATGLQGPMYLAVTEDSSVSLSISAPKILPGVATLVLKSAPLSYHEVFESSDFVDWKSLGVRQVLGGNRLTVEVPVESGEIRRFYRTQSR